MLPLEHSAILSTFIKLLFVIKIFVLSIFEGPLKTGFIVHYAFGEQPRFIQINNLEKNDPSEIERTYNIRKQQTQFY